MSATTATITGPLKRRKLPIGIQTFRQIREGNYYYADKTGLARRWCINCQEGVNCKTVDGFGGVPWKRKQLLV